MHEKRGNFCMFLLKIAEKEGETDLLHPRRHSATSRHTRHTRHWNRTSRKNLSEKSRFIDPSQATAGSQLSLSLSCLLPPGIPPGGLIKQPTGSVLDDAQTPGQV
jgi:hypothetical protein